MAETIDRKPRNLHICPPISPNDLLGSTLSDQYSYDLPFGEDPIHFYIIRQRTAIDLIGVQDGYIGGRRLNQLLHSIKPAEASFGIDTEDLLGDWEAIDKPAYAIRLARHAEIPGWGAFYKDKDMIWSLIKRAYASSNNWLAEDPNQGVKGVVWWRLKDGDTREVMLKKLIDQIRRPAFRYIVGRHIDSSENGAILSSVVGAWLLALYSPDIRADKSIWKTFDGYEGDSVNTRNMGTTQVGLMAVRYADTFLDGRFISNAQEYILSTLGN